MSTSVCSVGRKTQVRKKWQVPVSAKDIEATHGRGSLGWRVCQFWQVEKQLPQVMELPGDVPAKGAPLHSCDVETM